MRETLVFLFSILSLSANAQRIINDMPDSKLTPAERQIYNLKIRQNKLNVLRIDVKTPSGFSETPIRSIKSPFPGSSSEYTFINPDSTVLIVIALLAHDPASYEKEKLQEPENIAGREFNINGKIGFYPISHSQFQWYSAFIGSPNSSAVKGHFYTADELKVFNAEQGVMFKEKIIYLHLGKYENVRNITLNKKYRGQVEIRYFVKQGAKIDIEPIVAAAPNMISYK